MSKVILPTDPKRWGPPAWDFLYCVAFSYPHKPTKQERVDMQRFFMSLGNILPCLKCRGNYNKKMTNKPVKDALRSKKSLVLYVMNMKNGITKQNKKKKLDNYNDLCKKYYLTKLPY